MSFFILRFAGKSEVKSWCDEDLTTVLARLWAETRSSEEANNYERLEKGAKGKGKGKNTYRTEEGSGKGLDNEASRKSDAIFGERNVSIWNKRSGWKGRVL